MAKKKHLSQYDSAGNRQEIYLNDDEVMTGGKTLGDRLAEMQEDIRDAAEQGGIQQESDPTVPSWAKQPEKPTYTPQEVGAVPSQGYVEYTQAEKEKLRDLPNASELSTRLGEKANAVDVYDKQTVDQKVANAGKVKSVTVNGTNYTPNSSGVVDLGTIQGAKGDKGDKGDTVVIDPEGLAQFEIANDLDTSDPTQGLSARQGKILKQAISNVQANLQAVVDALANMAFTSAKPTLSQIDWTGGTFYATINKNLTGCTATDNTTNGQIVEGQTLTMQLTADSGFTLTGATISVTNSKGQSVAYTLNGSTLTVANVTGTITVSVVSVGVFSVSLGSGSSNIAFASGTPTEATSGSSWTGTIEAASGYKLPASIDVTMGGTAVTPTYNSTSGAITIANVTGNIVITAVAILDIGNVMFDNVRILGGSNGQGFALVGPHEEACITPLIEVPSGSSIEFNNGGTDGKNPITFYDENGDYVNFFSNNAAPRTVNMVTGAKYIRLSVPKANLSAAYIKVDNNVVWSYDNDTMLSYEMFLNSSYCPQPNARGDHEGCLPWMSYIGLDSPVANSLTNARQTTNATLRILLPKNGARDISAWPYVFCKMVEIPSDKEISFKAGELTGSDKLPYLQLYQKSDGEELKRSFYDLAASSSGVDAETMVRQVKVPNEYTHCSLVAKYDTYKNGEAYIKATSTNETLWSNK